VRERKNKIREEQKKEGAKTKTEKKVSKRKKKE